MAELEADARVAGADEVEQLVAVLADEGLEVVAGHVVPVDAVVVEVVQDGQARLVVALQNTRKRTLIQVITTLSRDCKGHRTRGPSFD